MLVPSQYTGAHAYPLSVEFKFLFALLFVVILANRYEAARVETQEGLDLERKKLKEANATLVYLKTAIEQSMDGIAVAGADKCLKFANEAWAIMHGYQLEEIQGVPVSIFHTAKQFEDDVIPFLKEMSAKGSNDGEVGHVRKDGTEFPCWMSISLMLDEAGERMGVVGVAKDITEKKAVEAALRVSEERNRALLEATPDAVAVYDGIGNVVYVNPAFEEQFGWTMDELLGKPLDFVPPEEKAKTEKLIAQLRTGDSVLVETRRLTKDGRLLDIQASASMFWDKDHRFLGTVVIIRDITERKKAEQILKEAKRAAEAANVAKSQFVANISHEIRTPMNGVIGMTGLLLDTDLDQRQREFAETIRSSASNLLNVINDVLDFSKIEAEKLELESISFDLRFTLEDTCDLLAIKAQEKGLEFMCMVDPDVPSLLLGDPGRLRQILINISNNAIKFTKVGEVLIRVSMVREEGDLAILRFSVSDTGIGIPKEKQGELFAPFTQMDTSTTREYGGTGLGLSICKRLVELMDGEIGISSQPGEGSTFWFSLPFGRQNQAAPPLPMGNIQGQRILIVDDNATNRRLLAVLLETWGCRFDETPDAPAAQKRLREAALKEKDPYAVVITDMQMPVMDGERLGRLIKEDPDLSPTALIMMTSIANRGDAARLSHIGFSAYLTKPIKQSVLFDCLQTVLGEEKPAQTAAAKPILTRHAIAESKKRRYRLLLVEDNTINRKVAMNILKNLGFRADEVVNGKEALRALEELPYDLVLMDCQMPEMDGYEATRQIRRQGSRVLNREIPIIAMTAHAMAGDREKCLNCGMDDYISKPVEPLILSQVVEKWLQNAVATVAAIQAFTAKPESAVFDRKGLISRMLDDQELVRDVLNAYLEDFPAQMRMLRQALDEDNATLAHLKAHTLAGASGNVGALAVRKTAYRMERAAREGDLEKARVLCVQLGVEAEVFREVLKKSGLLG
ncbi:MAG: response regulator [Desulfatibacillum sp.]|nr:response regulator [Desulfatibacillum sp.]